MRALLCVFDRLRYDHLLSEDRGSFGELVSSLDRFIKIGAGLRRDLGYLRARNSKGAHDCIMATGLVELHEHSDDHLNDDVIH